MGLGDGGGGILICSSWWGGGGGGSDGEWGLNMLKTWGDKLEEG